MEKKVQALVIFITLIFNFGAIAARAANGASLPKTHREASKKVYFNQGDQGALNEDPNLTSEIPLDDIPLDENVVEEPSHSCPQGQISFQKKQPSFNGCGGQTGSKLTKGIIKLGQSTVKKFEPCCNAHDICYGSCPENQKNCDTSFRTCMQEYCNTEVKGAFKRAICRGQTRALYRVVRVFGSGSFKSAQNNNCDCKVPEQNP